MRHFTFALGLSAALFGCNTVSTEPSSPEQAAAVPAHRPVSAAQGHAFARLHCSACHTVTGGKNSPNPNAPSFETIANARGLTNETLTTWLTDSHNYPDVMAFEIEAENIDDLAAYMLTLQRADYRPSID